MKFDRESITIANLLKFFASPEKLAFWRYALLILRRRYTAMYKDHLHLAALKLH